MNKHNLYSFTCADGPRATTASLCTVRSTLVLNRGVGSLPIGEHLLTYLDEKCLGYVLVFLV